MDTKILHPDLSFVPKHLADSPRSDVSDVTYHDRRFELIPLQHPPMSNQQYQPRVSLCSLSIGLDSPLLPSNTYALNQLSRQLKIFHALVFNLGLFLISCLLSNGVNQLICQDESKSSQRGRESPV